MYKIISSNKDTDVLSVDFHRNKKARETEITKNKTTKGNSHVIIYLKDVFGFAEHQENATYGLD